jgi:apolipoprotein N-acyltransferase
MHELITIEQANSIMLALIVIAPLVGLLIGNLTKQPKLGLLWGLGIGLLNFALWKLYNLIIDNLGLDTVKNLLVNLGLFIFLGLAGGVISAKLMSKSQSDHDKSDSTAREVN